MNFIIAVVDIDFQYLTGAAVELLSGWGIRLNGKNIFIIITRSVYFKNLLPRFTHNRLTLFQQWSNKYVNMLQVHTESLSHGNEPVDDVRDAENSLSHIPKVREKSSKATDG